MSSYTVTIRCPECGKIQQAQVEIGEPFNYYVHECTSCGYTIMESEWDEVCTCELPIIRGYEPYCLKCNKPINNKEDKK